MPNMGEGAAAKALLEQGIRIFSRSSHLVSFFPPIHPSSPFLLSAQTLFLLCKCPQADFLLCDSSSESLKPPEQDYHLLRFLLRERNLPCFQLSSQARSLTLKQHNCHLYARDCALYHTFHMLVSNLDMLCSRELPNAVYQMLQRPHCLTAAMSFAGAEASVEPKRVGNMPHMACG